MIADSLGVRSVLCAALWLALSCTAVVAQGAGATVRITPPSTMVAVDRTVEVAVEVQEVEGLYAADVQLSFDASVIEVVDADPETEGVQANLGTFLDAGFVARNEADNEAGTVHVAMTQLNPTPPRSGTGVLMVLTLRGKEREESTPLTIDEATLARRDGTPVEASLHSGEITVSNAVSEPPPDTPVATQSPTSVPATDTPQAAVTEPASSPTTTAQGTVAAQATTPSPTMIPSTTAASATAGLLATATPDTATPVMATPSPTLSAPGTEAPTVAQTAATGTGAAAATDTPTPEQGTPSEAATPPPPTEEEPASEATSPPSATTEAEPAANNETLPSPEATNGEVAIANQDNTLPTRSSTLSETTQGADPPSSRVDQLVTGMLALLLVVLFLTTVAIWIRSRQGSTHSNV